MKITDRVLVRSAIRQIFVASSAFESRKDFMLGVELLKMELENIDCPSRSDVVSQAYKSLPDDERMQVLRLLSGGYEESEWLGESCESK